MHLLHNLHALLVTNPVNIRYLTGFTGLSANEREGYALATSDRLILFIHPLYLEQARRLSRSPINQFSNKSINIVEISREETIAKKIKDCLEYLKQGRTLYPIKLGIEEDNLTLAEFNKLNSELGDVQLTSTRGRVESLRSNKRPEEIEYIRNAAKLTDECFIFILNNLKRGLTETEIAWKIETFFHTHGSASAFSPIVAYNNHSSQPHYYSGSDSLQGPTLNEPSLILLDFGAKFYGYCADMTRVVFIGRPTPEQKKAYETLLNAQLCALELLDCGERSGAALDLEVRQILEKSGYPPYPHSLGHCVGLAIHEGPRLSIKRNEELKPSMVVTIEPGIYLDGKFGMRIEDLVLIKENGIEILSSSPKKLIQI